MPDHFIFDMYGRTEGGSSVACFVRRVYVIPKRELYVQWDSDTTLKFRISAEKFCTPAMPRFANAGLKFPTFVPYTSQ